jgi:hypothetical protein
MTEISLSAALLELIYHLEEVEGVPATHRLAWRATNPIARRKKVHIPASGPEFVARFPGTQPVRRVKDRRVEGSEPLSPPCEVQPRSVPVLPNAHELIVILSDDRANSSRTTGAEKRLCLAHKCLIDWLSKGQITASARMIFGEPADKPIEYPTRISIAADLIKDMQLSYNADSYGIDRDNYFARGGNKFLCRGRLRYTCIQQDGEELVGATYYDDISINLKQFQPLLSELKSPVSRVTIVRPTGPKSEWHIRLDAEEEKFPGKRIGVEKLRGLKAIALAIFHRQQPIPYLLLVRLARAPHAPRERDDEVRLKHLAQLWKSVDPLVDALWERKINLPAAISELRGPLETFEESYSAPTWGEFVGALQEPGQAGANGTTYLAVHCRDGVQASLRQVNKIFNEMYPNLFERGCLLHGSHAMTAVTSAQLPVWTVE